MLSRFIIPRLFVFLLVILAACSTVEDRHSPLRTRYYTFEHPAPPLDKLRFEWSPELEYSLKHYMTIDPGHLRVAKENRDKYEPNLKTIFFTYGVPLELINVAAIESKFNIYARSNYGAVGIWQFMKPTAKQYGLKVSLLKDERKDPMLSTEAAALYLRDLYHQFRDWHWALAAYNAGPGRVSQFIKQYPNQSFWDIARTPGFPGQTKAFVSRVLAASIIEKNKIPHSRMEEERLLRIISLLKMAHA